MSITPPPFNDKVRSSDTKQIDSPIWRRWLSSIYEIIRHIGVASDGTPTWDGAAWGSGGTVPLPATSVTDFDATAAVGVSTKYARQDHKHGGAVAASGVTYDNVTYTTVESALDYLLYVPISIISYTINSGSDITLEIGNTVTITSLAWSTNKTPTTQTINSINRTSPYNPSATLSSNTTYTLSVGDGTTSATSARTVTLLHRRWWGASTDGTLGDADRTYTELAGLSSELSESKSKSFSVDCTGGKYPYFIILASLATPTCTVNGFSFTDFTVTTHNVTNQYSEVSSYKMIKFNNIQNGTISIVWT